MNDIILTICIVTYNHERYIDKCMEQILKQKCNFNFEVIVGNDCSTDKTAERLRKYEDKVAIINRRTNLGLCGNLYDLFIKAKGKYVMPFSGDDYIIDDYTMQKCVDFLENHPDYFSVAMWAYMYKQNEDKICKCQDETCPLEFQMEDFLSGKWFPCMLGVVRNTFSLDQGINYYIGKGARNNEEIKTWFYTLSKGKKYIIPEYMYVYRNISTGSSNYNSTHSFFDIFLDYYKDIKMLEKIFHRQYNFIPLIMTRCNWYILREKICAKTFVRFFSALSIRDRILFVFYKFYLRFHGYNNPYIWNKREYLIKEKKV